MNHYVDNSGAYLGAWDQGGPESGINVPVAPLDARQVWDFDTEVWGDIPVAIPTIVTMRQARAALIMAGLHETVYDAINAIEDDQDRALALNEWERSQVVERNRGLVIELASAIGLTESQLDDLFIFAASIP